jgi:phosphate transport system ATP-binding protein
MNKYAVNVNNFSFFYGQFQALKELTMNIHSLQITALIGPSGCGKSTFIKCLNRINERQGNVTYSGSMQVYGHDIYHPSSAIEEIRKNVGMVFQKPNPLPISIYENVVFGLRTHYTRGQLKKDFLDETVETSLKKVNLWDKAKDRLKHSALQMSLEEQQKLCIARLLPMKPKLILLDEPCSALDPKGTSAVEELIRELKKDYSIIIVTHSMSQARRISDETIFMYLGELIEMDSTEKIFTNPKETRTKNYIEGLF